MATNRVLQAKQINHGQSEVWLVADGNEITRHRILATNEVNNVVCRHTAGDVFKAFYADYHVGLEHVVSLSVDTLDVIATELKLQA